MAAQNHIFVHIGEHEYQVFFQIPPARNCSTIHASHDVAVRSRMLRNSLTALLFTGCVVAASVANATPVLVTSANSDGSKYAITYFLESSNATTAVYDITLWADTSGNTLGNQTLDSVAVGINL